jgi:hypothetical protein
MTTSCLSLKKPPLRHESASTPESPDASARRWGLATFVLAVVPVLVAIWGFPWFVTQDGPSHLYNTRVLAELFKPDSPYHGVYEVRLTPFPNWGGSLVLLGLLAFLPARAADQVMMSLTFVGFSATIVWLRWRVAGWQGMPIAAAIAVMVGMNLCWLMGFSTFLLGACLFAVTLGTWWSWRDRPGIGLALTLAGLLVVGYFFHLVSMGLTAIGLVVLSIFTPGTGQRSRLKWTLGGLAPLIPLGLIYRSLARDKGRLEWWRLSDPRSLRSWLTQVSWVDPISLTEKAKAPFLVSERFWYHLPAPSAWLAIALGVLIVVGLLRRRGRDDLCHNATVRHGWSVLALLFLVGGIAAPDSVGSGAYLSHRVFLLGLMALVPSLELDVGRRAGQVAGAVLAIALVLQTACVWDFARLSDHLVGAFMQAKPAVGQGQRVGSLIARCLLPTSYRANPMAHMGAMLGVDSGNIVLDNYEPLYPLFPIRFRDEAAHRLTRQFVPLACYDGDDGDPVERLARLGRLLERNHDMFDVLVVRGSRPEVDARIDPWFTPVFQAGEVRVLRRIPTIHQGDTDGTGAVTVVTEPPNMSGGQ